MLLRCNVDYSECLGSMMLGDAYVPIFYLLAVLKLVCGILIIDVAFFVLFIGDVYVVTVYFVFSSVLRILSTHNRVANFKIYFDFFIIMLVWVVLTVDLQDLRATGHVLVIEMDTVVGQEHHQVNLEVKRVEHLLITNLLSG